ncbi:MAG: hypothetical protein Q4E31_05890 [Intestinibacter bartlettii]|uniref:hypothetical protein n=1 Tax=Intestinibacter bartlettii TaxID=261299 RepID=UPI0026EDE8A0|nr:hypothetical protein [Intestinibacter bartlettii]MDO5010340.1 hypothetical protein [Intestinibacter bartlettii]
MDIIGQVVEHKSLGEGTICDHKIRSGASYIIVDFDGEHKEFQFPDIFKSIITAKDDNFKQYVSELVQKKQIIDKKEAMSRTLERQKEEKNLVRDEPVIRKTKVARAKKQNTKSTSTKVKHSKTEKKHNIAFKYNFCDGGKSDEQVGFNGLCSSKTIIENIESGRSEWCKFGDCACASYYDGEIDRDELERIYEEEGICYESNLLKKWTARAGFSYDEDGEATPRRIVGAKVDHLCILTTRNPEDQENERYIFAVFLIDETFPGDQNTQQEGYVKSNSKYKIKLSAKEAKKLLFWNYYHDKDGTEGTRWGTGLFRYMTDEMAAQILRDIAKVKKGTSDEKLADDFFKYFCAINNIDIESIGKKKGALKRI